MAGRTCVEGGKYPLECAREYSASFIMGETPGAGHDQRMRSGGQADDNPGELAGASGIAKRRGQRRRHILGRYTSADLRDRACGTCH